MLAYVGQRGYAFPPSTYDSTGLVINQAQDEHTQLPPDFESDLSENIEESILYQTTYASLEDCNQAGMANSRPGVSLLTQVNVQMYFNRLHHRDLFSWYFFGNPAETRKDCRYVASKEVWVRQDEDKFLTSMLNGHIVTIFIISESREKRTLWYSSLSTIALPKVLATIVVKFPTDWQM